MRLEHIELNRLSVSPANMRAKQKADIADILPSVRRRGILMPLLVRPESVPSGPGSEAEAQPQRGEPERFEIVAGSRRYLAAKTVAGESGESGVVPCAIMEAGDDAAALEASLIENLARADPDEVTQWETFTRLVGEGRAVEDIAATFGVTERLVRRILALGNLLPRIRSLYRKELIDAATARHLTLATKAQQREWLALYDSPDAYAPTGRVLKEWLFGGAAIPTTAALFDLADYPAPIVTDLFGEDSYFADSEAFWTLQRTAVEAKRQTYLNDGWLAVEVLEPGDYFQRWEHDKRSKAKGGKVYIALSPRGEVEIHEGWLPRKEARRSEQADTPPLPRREMTSALRTYVDLHRHAAVRAKLADHPQVALRLAVAHAIAGSPFWNVRPDPQRADKPATAESVETSAAEALFDAKRREVLALLGFDVEAPTVLGGSGFGGLTGLFQRLLELSDEEVLAVLAVVMGEALAVGSEAVDLLGLYLGVDMANLWQADDAFFALLRDKEVLAAMLAEVAGSEVAAANVGEKGKTVKAIIRDCLAGENERVEREGWVPAWMRFPAGSYTSRGEALPEPQEMDEAA
jgi:ParB family chromosome partitioning protein